MSLQTYPDRFDELTRIGRDLGHDLSRVRTDDRLTDNERASAVDRVLASARVALQAAGLLDGVSAWADRMSAVAAALHATKRPLEGEVWHDVATAADYVGDAAFRMACAAEALECEPELPFGFDDYARLPLGEAA
jgi:hypothetical protein